MSGFQVLRIIHVDPCKSGADFSAKGNGPMFSHEAVIYVESFCRRERSGSLQAKS